MSAGSPSPPNKLPVSLLPDYHALLGKKEAGVRGAGISARMAVNLMIK